MYSGQYTLYLPSFLHGKKQEKTNHSYNSEESFSLNETLYKVLGNIWSKE